ncbi:CmeU family protein [Campylobacter hyointestinalis]|uniref:Chain-length determining protein n=2 Tax=Campylobacter hyointestinalis TaxID=198 RepID=A0A855N7Q3_CAMHY|nr:CmeU family protein [Campylobacter hyointestinalis]ANE33235.1 hypothetical protein CHH_1627 [Campylobacter hyointestinalis subsp. hyointestinalis LMG 9260]KAB0611375.1 hypothetical protein F7P66_08485 [Campylobacter hyointestinalis subsp. lawsonii]MBT0611335.1 hypothetical protein [Campylobacter hyointestinalis subsp. hyointestinalis]MDL2346302.1 CmeU family protein [Campylobacter hyointestinalis]MDL2348042.1 CmeU family protein [Campylobacter hyointestinalis]
MEEVSEQERVFIKNQIESMLKARDAFFEVLDKNVPKQGNSNVFDFESCKDKSLKDLYKEFYAYDYSIRKILPYVYKRFGVSFNV